MNLGIGTEGINWIPVALGNIEIWSCERGKNSRIFSSKEGIYSFKNELRTSQALVAEVLYTPC